MPLIATLDMRPRQRKQRVDTRSGVLEYIQRRNALASKCHKQETLRRLEELGIIVRQLRCCQIE